jgi:hypothetical protein
MTLVLTTLTYIIWFCMLYYELPMMLPKQEDFDVGKAEQLIAQYRRALEWQVGVPVAAAAYAMSIWAVAGFFLSWTRFNADKIHETLRISFGDPFMNVFITLGVIGLALLGFFSLAPYGATLWLLFLIVALPPALVYTDPVTRRRLKEASVLKVYEAGLKQVPVIGNLVSRLFSKDKPPGPPHDEHASE